MSTPDIRVPTNGHRRGPQARLSGPMRGVHIPTNRPSDSAATRSNNMPHDPYSRFFVECSMCIRSCAPILRWDACWRRHRCAWLGSRVWIDAEYTKRPDVERNTCLDGTCAVISAIRPVDVRGLSWSNSAARTAVARVDDGQSRHDRTTKGMMT